LHSKHGKIFLYSSVFQPFLVRGTFYVFKKIWQHLVENDNFAAPFVCNINKKPVISNLAAPLTTLSGNLVCRGKLVRNRCYTGFNLKKNILGSYLGA
jgi:hypothetical protein